MTRHRNFLLPLLVWIAACGQPARPTQPTTEQATEQTTEPGPLPPNPAHCPADFGASGSCDAALSPGRTCNYAAGSCYCGVASICSGAVMGPPEPVQATTWLCTAKPPAVRPDGCPGVEPSGACAASGKQCQYGSCCVSTYTCTGGAWKQTAAVCPP